MTPSNRRYGARADYAKYMLAKQSLDARDGNEELIDLHRHNAALREENENLPKVEVSL